jgi:two-component system LytT family response regulator
VATDPIRTLIVDDELPARRRLTELLSARAHVDLVGAAAEGHEAVRLIRDLRPQLLFLDIQMPGLDGFGVLRAIEPAHVPVTVFVTAYDRYAVSAFEAHAVDYLLKPFGDERFDAALEHASRSVRLLTSYERRAQIDSLLEERSATNRRGHLDRIALKSGGRVTLLGVDAIDWIGAAGIYLELHVGQTMHLYRSSLTSLLERLDPEQFVRTHRSVIVNTDRIKELRPRGHSDYTVILKDGRLLPLSRAYRGQLERWLGQPL